MDIKSEKQKGALNIYMAEVTDIDKKDGQTKQNCHGSPEKMFRL